jgi:MtrB/PioB family decaheme-associated outer membrane protein
MRPRLVFCLVFMSGVLVPPGAIAQTSAPESQPPAQSASAQAAPGAGIDVSGSLFDRSPNQFQFGGRLNSVSGDPARFQRYQDRRDGVSFTDARYARDDPAGLWLFRAAADNVGYRDQRYIANYQRPGRVTVTGFWDQIPQFYSIDTRTPYTSSESPLPLDDTTQRQIQNEQATLSAYVPLASQFELHERRDVGNVSVSATPTPRLDVKAAFTTTRHVGELPWGASFGFSNDVEVALPYDSRTNDFVLGTEWTNSRTMFRVAYNGSWFNNLDDTLIWDSPLSLVDAVDQPSRGRSALWPSNAAQTISAAGYAKFARRSQLTGFVSYGVWTNDEPLQPFTINTALPQLPLPRTSSEAEAHVVSANMNFVSQPVTDWRFSARARTYGYNNETTAASITQFISYDSDIGTSLTGGPRLYAHNRTTFDADATWTGLQPLALTAGYTRNNGTYDFRIFESTGEDVFRLSADAIGSQWLTFRANYELAGRSGSGLDESVLTQVGEQPALRHYDVANRNRNRFTGQIDVVPNDVWVFSASAGAGKDDYDDSYFGLQESTFRTFSFGADFLLPNGWGGGGSYNYERYAGLQQSRSANSDQAADPLRDWTADSTERVDYFSIYARPPRIGRNTEARVSYDYSYAQGNYLYNVVPGGPLPPPSQLPKVYNKLQQLNLEVRHRLSDRLAATFSYIYEPFRVYDFAFDETVINSIVQPSSLVLGYVYRPYTANSAVFGLRYWW